ncbi:MAG: hypothetical protein NDF54_06820 [archaeon GB-1867-035]|nr:hypothetical protein [Candidatus Culexmicrobium profundum]
MLFRKIPPSYSIMATNRSGLAIALKTKIKEGQIYILPPPTGKLDKYYYFLQRLLIICGNDILKKKYALRQIEPDWVSNYIDLIEREYYKKYLEIKEKYDLIKEARRLLYAMHKPLSKTVYKILRGMDFNATYIEKKGVHDIEINEENFKAIIEVTSAEKNWIDREAVRQVLDWASHFEKVKGLKPKPIIIANPYAKIPISERKEPYTLGAIQKAKEENVCLMTSYQLYQLFCKYIKKEIDKEHVKKLMRDTVGLVPNIANSSL